MLTVSATLAGGALAGCSTKEAVVGGEPSSTPKPTESAAPATRFAGDPGPGNILLGISLAIRQAASERTDIGGDDITMSRRFYRAHQLELMQTMAEQDVAAGIAPFVSLKVPGTWRDVANGSEDTWLNTAINKLAKLNAPIFLALNHEPENDHSGNGNNVPEAWQDMHRRAAKVAGRRAPLVTVVPVMMQWTFNPESGRNPTDWVIPDLPVAGVDVYNPWQPAGSRPWVEFDAMITQVRTVIPDLPILVPEFGCASDPADPARASMWLRAAYESGLRQNVAGMAWFDSDYNNEDGTLKLDESGTAVLSELLRRPETVRVEPGA